MSKKKSVPEKTAKDFVTGELYKYLNQHPNKTFNHKQLAKLIKPDYIEYLSEQKQAPVADEGIKSILKKEIISLMEELVTKGELIETNRGQYKLKPKHAYMEGIIDITPQGAAYLLSENEEEDIYIAPRNVKNALNRDRVKIYLYAKHKNQRLEGEVVEVLQRAKTEFVGRVQLSGRFAFVVPDSPKMLVDIFIPENKIGKAKDGQKVVAKISEWQPGA